jgi:hypothetical protein
MQCREFRFLNNYLKRDSKRLKNPAAISNAAGFLIKMNV